jgi:hypothetical protein
MTPSAVSKEPLYTLLSPHASVVSSMECWSKVVGRFSDVLGYSNLGLFFLRDPAANEYVVLHPLSYGKNAKFYGALDSIDTFEKEILNDPLFVEQLLRPNDVSLLRERLGKLGPEEVYYPVPYPCLGGSGELSTFEKGNVWVFADILGQTLGLDE